jgi:capsular polysaccharide transport system permease protein
MLGLAVVLAPVAAAAYFKTIASPMYVSEARFSIQGQNPAAALGGSIGGALATGASGLSTIVDGYAVHDFIESRDGFRTLEKTVGFTKREAKPDADPLVRVRANATEDDLYKLYTSLVQVRFNIVEQIVVLRVFAFTPEDARTLAAGLVKASQDFADGQNRQSRQQWLDLMQQQLTDAEKRVVDARQAISNWRQKNGNIDPNANVTILNTVLGQVEAAIADAQAQLTQANSLGTVNSPKQRALMQQITALQNQAKDTSARMAGVSTSQAAAMVEFQRLTAEQGFAETNLNNQRSALLQAQVAMGQQQKYVAVVAAPSLSVVAAYPDTLTLFGGAFAVGLGCLLTGSLLLGVARDTLAR